MIKTLLVARNSNPTHTGLSNKRRIYWLIQLKGLGVPLGTAGSRHRILSTGLGLFIFCSAFSRNNFSLQLSVPTWWQGGHLAATVNKSASLLLVPEPVMEVSHCPGSQLLPIPEPITMAMEGWYAVGKEELVLVDQLYPQTSKITRLAGARG